MTSPNPSNEPDSNQQPSEASRRRRWRRILIPVGGVLLAGIAGGAWWGWVFVNEQLAPLIERNLSQSLNRPVKLGRVERFSLNSLRVGRSEVPAIPSDSDRVSIESIEVKFNLLRILLTRNLNLDITLDRPDLYLAQDEKGVWLATEIQEQEEEGPIRTELEVIRFRDAQLTLVPWGKYGNKPGLPVVLNQANGTAKFSDQNRKISYEVEAQSTKGGRIDILGETLRPAKQPIQTNLQVKAQDFLVSEVDRLAKLPVDLQTGRADGNLNVRIRSDQKRIPIDGTATFEGVTLKIPNVATTFNQAKGGLRLDDTLIQLDDVSARYGTVPLTANGTIDTEKGFNLAAKVNPVSVAAVVDSLNLELPFGAAGQVRADLKVTGDIDTPVISGFGQSTQPVRVDRVNLRRASTNFRFDTGAQTLTLNNLRAEPAAGGTVTGGGTLALKGERPDAAFNFQVNSVPADTIAQAYAGNGIPTIGTVSAQGQIRGALNQLQVNVANAEIAPPGGGRITGAGTVGLGGTNPNLALTFQATGVSGDNLLRPYAEVPFAIGSVTAIGQANGTLNDLRVNLANVLISPPQGGTIVAAGQARLGNTSQLALNYRINQVPADAIARAYNNGSAFPFTLGRVSAAGQIGGSLTNPLVTSEWRVTGGTYPGSGSLLVRDRVLNLRDTVLSVAGGTINAQARIAQSGNWQATVRGSNVRLSQFSRDLSGRFSGNFVASGTSFRPADVRVRGNATLSEGVSLIAQPLTAQVRWDGSKVILDQAASANFQGNGLLFVNLNGTPALTGLDLNVRLNDYNLREFRLPRAVPIRYAGRTDFTGRISGSPAAPNVVGNISLKDFVLNPSNRSIASGSPPGQPDPTTLVFEPVLRGTVQVGNGVNLNLRGDRDIIAARLDSSYYPLSFNIQSGQTFARGNTQGDRLNFEVQQFPLALANAAGLPLTAPVSGTLTGDGSVNLRTFNGEARLAIARPAFGSYRADRFSGEVRFRNGVGELIGGELVRGKTTLQLAGTANIAGGDPQVNGKLNVANGNVQDVLALLQYFDISDFQRTALLPAYGTAADLQTTPVNLVNATILDQLRRLAEIRVLLAQSETQRQRQPIPELRDLVGTFDGNISVVGSQRTGIRADFNIEGRDWKWGTYEADQVIATGNFDRGVLTLLPLRLQTNDAFISFTGQVGGREQSGQFRMENVPIDQIRELAARTVGGQLAQSIDSLMLEGKLDLTATISGGLENPQAVGQLSLEDATLKGTSIQSARGNFQYTNARLSFGNTILIAGKEPITIDGSLPYRLPFATVSPDSSEISLDVDVKDEGLAFINLVNNQVTWVDGRGSVELRVRGTLLQPRIGGSAVIQDATLSARALPEQITNVNGRINFNNDRLSIESLQGQFSRGQIQVSGPLPLLVPFSPEDPAYGKTIVADLSNIALNLKGLYRGGVDGKVTVGGTALSPEVGGVIRLSNGQVLLETATAGGAGGGAGGGAQQEESPIELQDLRIELGDRVQVTQAPILNFVASGNLTVNGSLNDLRPRGVIRLLSGQVNIFTTQFNLVRGYPQTAEFVESQGLDPNLDVRLITSVPEVTNYRQPTGTELAEILESPLPASSFGGLQTVRIRADVRGRASQLFENLELTSSPARSESEIVGLLGGGFVATLGRGDSVLGIANLAGSALLTNVQSAIGNALGLSEFRLFTTLTNENRREESSRASSTLGLAAEAAIDITPNVSVSAVKILTNSDPPQFGIRYRVNDRVLLRGSTDFSGDNRAVVEYEARF